MLTAMLGGRQKPFKRPVFGARSGSGGQHLAVTGWSSAILAGSGICLPVVMWPGIRPIRELVGRVIRANVPAVSNCCFDLYVESL